MKLKKPAKDHRGEWDLVLVNKLGYTVAALYMDADTATFKVQWPEPTLSRRTHRATWAEMIMFLQLFEVDTAPLGKLREEKGASTQSCD